MKICFSASGKDLNSLVDSRFGRCPWFIFLDEESGEFTAEENPGFKAFRGAGVLAAQTVVGKKVKAVISGNVGPNAFLILQQKGIKLYRALGMSVAQAGEKYKKGELEEIKVSSRGGRGWGRR